MQRQTFAGLPGRDPRWDYIDCGPRPVRPRRDRSPMTRTLPEIRADHGLKPADDSHALTELAAEV